MGPYLIPSSDYYITRLLNEFQNMHLLECGCLTLDLQCFRTKWARTSPTR